MLIPALMNRWKVFILRDGVYSQFYDPHLKGGVTSNPADNMMDLTRSMYANMLTELCVNRFEWKELPPEIDPRYLELNLFWRALTVFFYHKDTNKYMTLNAAGNGMPNAQDVPTHFTVTAPNMLISEVLETGKDCIPIWANYMRRPEIDKVAIYAYKLASLDRTIEINSENMRYTKLVSVDENRRHSMINVMQQHAKGQPVIFGSKQLREDMDNVSVFDIGTNPETLPKLLDAKSKMWNECMTMLGINNSNQDKRERLVAAEVGANDQQIESTRNIALNARQFAAEQINALYDLNVSVDFRAGPNPEDFEDEDGSMEESEPEKLKAVS